MSTLWSVYIEACTPTFVAASDEGSIVMSVEQTLKAVSRG